MMYCQAETFNYIFTYVLSMANILAQKLGTNSVACLPGGSSCQALVQVS